MRPAPPPGLLPAAGRQNAGAGARTAGCPAFDDIAMLEAIERAARQRFLLPCWPRLIRPGARTRKPVLTGECP
jgi:hypothetical protein